MTLLERIEKYLKDRHISATRFGRRAVGDPRFVLDLRQGRKPRRRTLERLEAYLQSVESTNPDCIKSEGECARQADNSDLQHPARVLPRRARRPGLADRSSTQ